MLLTKKLKLHFDYLNEFCLNSVSDEDKKKFDAIEEAIAEMDLLYCELQGDVEEDADDIRAPVEPYIPEDKLDEHITELVEIVCDGLSVYKRAFEILENMPEWDENWMLQKALEQADAEIKQQKEDKDD